MDYEIHDQVVLDFHRSTAPHRFVSAPARTSKSYSAAPEIVHDFFPTVELSDEPWPQAIADQIPAGIQRTVASHHETICWIVAVDYATAKEWDYCWTALIDKNLIEAMGGIIESKANTPNQGNMVIRARWPMLEVDGGPAVRSVIAVKSATNEKSLQGEEIKTCILSEAAEHDERILRKYLLTRCERLIYPTTPKRKAMWAWDMIQAGAESPELGIEHFQYTGNCNPTYDWDRFRRAERKAELAYGTAEEDPEFAEQFLGHWTFNEGKVLPFRWLPNDSYSNVTSHIPPWLPYATWFVSMDYGYDDPACVHFWAVDVDGSIFLASEIYERHLLTSDLVQRIDERCDYLGINVKSYIPDPQKPELTEIMRRLGLPIYDRMKPSELRSREAGYSELRDAIGVNPDTGRPRLMVHSSCEQTIHEWKTIRFKEGHSNEFADGAIVGKDHATDSARHFVRSRVRGDRREATWVDQWTRQQKEILKSKDREQMRRSSSVYAEVAA